MAGGAGREQGLGENSHYENMVCSPAPSLQDLQDRGTAGKWNIFKDLESVSVLGSKRAIISLNRNLINPSDL